MAEWRHMTEWQQDGYLAEWYKMPPKKRTRWDRLFRRDVLCLACGGRGWYPGGCEFAACTCEACKGHGWIRG